MGELPSALWLGIVLPLACLALATARIVVTAVRRGGRREEPTGDPDALSVSRFTIPVSVIVPGGDDAALLTVAVDRLLGLNYPEYEIIVVIEDPRLLDALRSHWSLQPKEFFYRRSLKTAAVEGIYRSSSHPRLMAIRKAPRGRADALNCGVNVARFRYVTSLNPNVAFDRDALLRAMLALLRDPARISGASSHVETRPLAGGGHWERFSAAFERLESIRSIAHSRLAWMHRPCGLGPHGGIVVWQRDAIVGAGGFSASAADGDLEMMVHLQQSGGEEPASRVVRTPEIFGWIGATALPDVVDSARRRFLASWQAALALVRPLASRGGGDFITGASRCFVLTELAAPLAQLWIVLLAVAGAATGSLTWSNVALLLFLLSFGNALVSNAALLLRGAAPEAPSGRELRRLVVLGPTSFFLYSPLLLYAGLTAVWSLLRGDEIV